MLLVAGAQHSSAAVMCLGLSRHYRRPLPLELEMISLGEWLETGKKSETNVVMQRAHLGEVSIGWVGGGGRVKCLLWRSSTDVKLESLRCWSVSVQVI